MRLYQRQTPSGRGCGWVSPRIAFPEGFSMPSLRRSLKLSSLSLFLIAAVPLAAQTIVELEKQAATGDPAAAFQMGIEYAAGQRVAFDIAKALDWYRKAAAKGYGEAEYNLGVAYHNGLGVAKDEA